jgi:hypothetical protein
VTPQAPAWPAAACAPRGSDWCPVVGNRSGASRAFSDRGQRTPLAPATA